MSRRLIVHIGVMKSGTTYLQKKLSRNHQRLAEQGIHFAVPWARQIQGYKELRGATYASTGAWADLRSAIDGHPGTSLISVEHFASMDPDSVRRLAEEFPDTTVDIVLTVRDLGRQVPSAWQSTLKNGHAWSFEEYVAGIASSEPNDARRQFWSRQHIPRIVRKWSQVFGTDRLTVVLVPPPGSPHSLWERFCAAADIADADGWPEPERTNQSLGAASAQLLIKVNALAGELTPPDQRRLIKPLARDVLPALALDEPAIGFQVPDWLRARAAADADALKRSGVRLIGDLSDLTPVDVPGVAPSGLGPTDELEVAANALTALLMAGGGAAARADRD
ncbi:hypothetical protein E8D34_09685 [Nocardioides sp. GY 10113]|uniref:hypothetical protein n=1 Tax=Nocardioides sp. GY 10113 TaxID=2569761 RepID=UPI0010A8389A|nr:hypothetical protein [Nocardioides sp. GY 10113]TIC87393.1 hypothetical protein E8D34_09685 [Nocardioides sp. GY 10113]